MLVVNIRDPTVQIRQITLPESFIKGSIPADKRSRYKENEYYNGHAKVNAKVARVDEKRGTETQEVEQ